MTEARRIVTDYNETIHNIVVWLDESADSDSGSDEPVTLAQVEAQQRTIAQGLYDAYLFHVSYTMLRAPGLSVLQWGECREVTLRPCHAVSREALVQWGQRDRFFHDCIESIVIPCLVSAAPNM